MDSRTRQAARTTIVGGQPPGNSRDEVPVPAALEDLLSMAAASPEFASALVRDRIRVAEAARVTLSPAETAILGAVAEASLWQMIARVGSALPQPERRWFLERAVSAVAVLVGGVALSACSDKVAQTKKKADPPSLPAPPIEPDAALPEPSRPPGRIRPTELDVDGGARPDRVNVPRGIRPDPPGDPAGIRPDRPHERPRERPQDSDLGVPIGGVRPTRTSPSHPATTTGIRPDRR